MYNLLWETEYEVIRFLHQIIVLTKKQIATLNL